MEYTARAAVHIPGSSWRQVIMGDKLILDLLYHLHADRNFRGTRTVHAQSDGVDSDLELAEVSRLIPL